MDEKDFALRLAQLREKKNVSAREMSLAIGQNPGYINNIESGKSLPSLPGVFYICDYLGISVICGDTVTEDFVMPDGVFSCANTITGIAFHGIDLSVLDLLNDARMVGKSVLRTRRTIGRVPIEEDNHTCHRLG